MPVQSFSLCVHSNKALWYHFTVTSFAFNVGESPQLPTAAEIHTYGRDAHYEFTDDDEEKQAACSLLIKPKLVFMTP